MSETVSIIVPVYGVESYIRRCAKSLFLQTYTDIEYVFVNDCSRDRSVEILQETMSSYPGRKVRIISHDTNMGLGAARKTGLMAATGTYILNVDSDDYLEPDTVALLVAEAQRTGADIVAFDCYFEWEKTLKAYHRHWDNNPREYAKMLLSGRALPGVCNHMIRRSLYTSNNLYPLPGINVGEDYVLMPRLTAKAERIAYVPRPFYHYTQTNSSSYTSCLSERNIMDLVQVSKILSEWAEINPQYREALQEGLWMKKTDLMMNASSSQYDLIEQMATEPPCRIASMNLPQRIAAIGVIKQWYEFISVYGTVYRFAMMLLQKLKGR